MGNPNQLSEVLGPEDMDPGFVLGVFRMFKDGKKLGSDVSSSLRISVAEVLNADSFEAELQKRPGVALLIDTAHFNRQQSPGITSSSTAMRAIITDQRVIDAKEQYNESGTEIDRQKMLLTAWFSFFEGYEKIYAEYSDS